MFLPRARTATIATIRIFGVHRGTAGDDLSINRIPHFVAGEIHISRRRLARVRTYVARRNSETDRDFSPVREIVWEIR